MIIPHGHGTFFYCDEHVDERPRSNLKQGVIFVVGACHPTWSALYRCISVACSNPPTFAVDRRYRIRTNITLEEKKEEERKKKLKKLKQEKDLLDKWSQYD